MDKEPVKKNNLKLRMRWRGRYIPWNRVPGEAQRGRIMVTGRWNSLNRLEENK